MNPLQKLASLEAKIAKLEQTLKVSSHEEVSSLLDEIVREGSELLVTLHKSQTVYKNTLMALYDLMDKTNKISHKTMGMDDEKKVMANAFISKAPALLAITKKAFHDEKDNWANLTEPVTAILQMVQSIYKEFNRNK